MPSRFETLETNDVHSAESFGFDTTNPADAKKWAEITGELPLIEVHTDRDSDYYLIKPGETRGD